MDYRVIATVDGEVHMFIITAVDYTRAGGLAVQHAGELAFDDYVKSDFLITADKNGVHTYRHWNGSCSLTVARADVQATFEYGQYVEVFCGGSWRTTRVFRTVGNMVVAKREGLTWAGANDYVRAV